MGCAADDESVHFVVVLFVSQHFDEFFEIYFPDPKSDVAVFHQTVRLEIIIIKSLDSLIINIFEWF